MARNAAYEDVRIGPFVGGLNTLSDQTSIADEELFQLENFELDKDGSLVSRPPIVQPSSVALSGNGLKLLGYFIDSGTQTYYLIASNRATGTYYYSSGAWVSITPTFAATACVQYRDKLHLVAPPGSSNPGGSWTPGGGFTADANMPKGTSIVANKERLWIVQGKNAPSNGSRVYLSGLPTDPLLWPASPLFISAGTGDGQNIVDITVYYSDLVIFKQASTYRFTFGTDPQTGSTDRISSTVGATDTGCWTSFENRLFVLYNNSVYEFTNFIFDRINNTVPFKATNASTSLVETASISAWSNRLFVSYYDVCYVYNIITRTWCTWKSSKLVTIGAVYPIPFQQNERPSAFMYSTQPLGVALSKYLYQVTDAVLPGVPGNTDSSETIVCTFETKNYDYQSPSKFKRLRMWSADVLTRANINVYAQPVQYGVAVIWNQLLPYTWNQLSTGTWDQPLDSGYVVADAVSIEGTVGGRKFVKFMKSLRFRQISFKMNAQTTGTNLDAPVRVYSLVTPVREKQSVSKKVS